MCYHKVVVGFALALCDMSTNTSPTGLRAMAPTGIKAPRDPLLVIACTHPSSFDLELCNLWDTHFCKKIIT